RYRLFADIQHLANAIEFHNPIAFWILNGMRKNRGPSGPLGGLLQDPGQVIAVKNIVPEYQCTCVAFDEFLADDQCLSHAIGRLLLSITNIYSPFTAIAQELPEPWHIGWRRDHKDRSNSREHEHAQRVVNHWLVIYRQELFRRAVSYRIKTRPGTTCKNDSP